METNFHLLNITPLPPGILVDLDKRTSRSQWKIAAANSLAMSLNTVDGLDFVAFTGGVPAELIVNFINLAVINTFRSTGHIAHAASGPISDGRVTATPRSQYDAAMAAIDTIRQLGSSDSIRQHVLRMSVDIPAINAQGLFR